jgi:hypothetical protein
MSQRLSLDRRSFKQFLSTLFRQMKRQGLGGSAGHRIDPQWLPDLIQIRQEVKSGSPDLNAVINRLAKLTQGVVGARGAGVWLFTNDEIFYCAGAGSASNDERLRLEVISKLATSCQLSKDSLPRLGEPTATATVYDASHGPGCARSLLVEPIYQGHDIAGALAAFSDELNAFTDRDVADIHLLAHTLAQALSKAAEAGLAQSVALEPAAMLQLIERIIPALQRILESDEQESHESGEEIRAPEAMGRTWIEPDQAPPAAPEDAATSSVLDDTNAPGTGLPGALESKVVETSPLGPAVRQMWERTVAFVRNYASRASRVLKLAASWLSNRAEKAGHQVWRTARYRSDPPPVSAKAAYSGLRRMKALISRAGRSAKTQLQMLLRSRPSLHTLYRAAPLLAILIITITFLILRTGLHHPAQTTASSSRTTAQQNTIPLNAGSPEYREAVRSDGVGKAGIREAYVAEQFGRSAPLQVSHMQVTDRTTEDAVQTLSRYELAGLRRRAVYGDDSAAFQMGMAYEIGRGVPQSCTTAAQWVARAAGEGNSAAQYNLGLRYRDGDGVPVNEDEAAKWLQKAATQQSSDAQLALMALSAHQQRTAPSRP